MTEAHLGRLLPACLHQAIAETLPLRLDFYEEWLDSDGLRDGRIGLAPLSAVLGFLRSEAPAYQVVMTRAGELAATWTLSDLPRFRRRVISALPLALRSRVALRVASRIARQMFPVGNARVRVRRGQARLSLPQSFFCQARSPQTQPQCDFYVALATGILQGLDVTSRARVETCRAVSGGACVIVVDLAGAQEAPPAVAA